MSNSGVDVAVIGAGPAALTAAYLLGKAGYSVTVIEKDSVYVGGISRYCVVRNGMHRHNNQDHAMTATLIVQNIQAGARIHDIWSVNEDADYYASGKAGERTGIATALSSVRSPPESLPDTPLENLKAA